MPLLLVLIVLFSAPLGADEAKNADDIIHNDKLRAETGSTSTWSVATSLVYNGSRVSRPFADLRPNLSEANGVTDVASIDGGINIKYNINARDSIFVGETVRWITPLSSLDRVPSDYRGQKFDSYNPMINYQRIYKLGQADSYFQIGPTIYTQSDYSSIGYLWNMWLYNANAYQIGRSRYTVGLETNVINSWFRKPQAYPEFGMSVHDTKERSTDWLLSATPYLEVEIADSLSFRTACMWFSVEHTLLNKWVIDRAIQSVGFGFSVTRDIYINPEIQFVPDQLRLKDTAFALISNINIF